MRTSNHIPAYLMCERFADGRSVLDLFPPDYRGSHHLLRTARDVAVVENDPKQIADTADSRLNVVKGSRNQLPFADAAFDLVVCTHMAFSPSFGLDEAAAEIKRVLSSSGQAAMLIPNRENMDPSEAVQSQVPDFMMLERTLRHYFPHILVFAQQPLFGATLTPIGRRPKQDGPLLDDRMLPEEGETPDYFLAMCSLRYEKFDDTTIAQLPFSPVRDEMRLQIEKYEGTIRLIQQEKRARDTRIAQLMQQVDSLTDKLADADMELQDKASLTGKIDFLNEQIERKNAIVEKLNEQLQEKTDAISQLEDVIESQKRDLRLTEKTVRDLERQQQSFAEDQQLFDEERATLIESTNEANRRVLEKERALNESNETVRHKSKELEATRTLVESLEEELRNAREQYQQLKRQSQDARYDVSSVETLKAEMARSIEQSDTEKAHLGQQLEAKQKALLEVIADKEDFKKQCGELQLKHKALEMQLEEARSVSVDRDMNLELMTEKLESLQSELRQVQEEKRTHHARSEELVQQLSEAQNEVALKSKRIASLEQQQGQAADHEKTLSEAQTKLQKELANQNRRVSELEIAAADLTALNQKYQVLLQDNSNLKKQMAEERSSRENAQLEGQAASIIQSKYENAVAQVEKLRTELTSHESKYVELEVKALRLGQLEQRHKASMGQIELLHKEIGKLRAKETVTSDQEQQLRQLRDDYQKLQLQYQNNERKLQATTDKMSKLEGDLEMAMGELAISEEGAEKKMHTAAKKIKALKGELKRLKDMGETELHYVKGDMQNELKHTIRQLELSQQEIWELREEVIRTQAQAAASAAAATHEGKSAELQQTLMAQEAHISKLAEDRRRLKAENESFRKSLEKRKKNLKILASMIQKEDDGEISMHEKRSEQFNLNNFFASDGEDLLFEDEFIDNERLDEEDNAIVDAIMESAVKKHPKVDAETSVHISTEHLKDMK